VALDKNNGNLIWRSKDLQDEATFGSMVLANLGGVRQYVHTTFKGSGEGGRIVWVSAKEGKLLWSFDQDKFNDVDVCSTPIVTGDYVYVSAGRKAGCVLLQIKTDGGKFKVQSLYKKVAVRRLMDNEYGGVALVDGYVFGYTDNQRGAWICQELKTGAQKWRSNKLAKGCLTCAGGQLYLYTEDQGEVALVDASAKGWRELGRFEIPVKSKVPETHKGNSGAKIWTHPVVANGCLYLRDQEYLFCYQVRSEK
jgi:outer membrane protein assembly factor BamB